MSHKDILTKAIEKAIAGSFTVHNYIPDSFVVRDDLVTLFEIAEPIDFFEDEELVTETNTYAYSLYDLIFNHEFARAIFGEKGKVPKDLRDWKKEIPDLELPKVNKGWQYHLQMMVVDPNPVEYLARHIDG